MSQNRLPVLFAVFSFAFLYLAPQARAESVLVLPFHNNSRFSDLNWVGESVSEVLRKEFSAQSLIVFGRESRTEALRRMSLRPGADFTKATLIRLGQSLDADYLSYGSYEATLSDNSSELKNSTVQISAHLIDLRKLHDGPDFSESGKLADLSRLQEHLAWQALRYLAPNLNLSLDAFLAPAKLTRVDALESYIRGLLSTNKDQQQKWFTQALALDRQFTDPAYELGRLALERKDFKDAVNWFRRIPASDPRYPEALFKLGLASYGTKDYTAAANYYRELAKTYPTNEVYNNLGVAESETNQPAAADDLRRAVEGDGKDPVYLFNLGDVLLKNNNFDSAVVYLKQVKEIDPDDADTAALLARAQRRETMSAGSKAPAPGRLKTQSDLTAFRQLKAITQPEGSK